MWSKLTDINNRTKSKIISYPHKPHWFLATPGIEFANLMLASVDVVCAICCFIPILRHTNEVIGAYMTAVASLHLYTYLDRLQEGALYYDTDSI